MFLLTDQQPMIATIMADESDHFCRNFEENEVPRLLSSSGLCPPPPYIQGLI